MITSERKRRNVMVQQWIWKRDEADGKQKTLSEDEDCKSTG